jgi:hypothetical protein
MTQIQSWGGGFQIETSGETRGEIVIHRDEALEEGAIVAHVQFPIGTPESEVKVRSNLLLDVSFQDGIIAPRRQRGIVTHLKKIIHAVKDVIRHFEGAVANNPHWIRP